MYVYDVYQVSLNAPHDPHYPLGGAYANNAMFMDLMVHGTLRLTSLCIKVSPLSSLYKYVHSKGKMPTINSSLSQLRAKDTTHFEWEYVP